MLFATATSAQKIHLGTIQWKISGTLPSANGELESLGFAGLIAGVNHEVLIVAGGSNFPDSMPWLGGKKKYYDDIYVLKKNQHGFFENYKSFKLPYAIAYVASCSTSEGVLSAGGENQNGLIDRALMMQWDKANKKIIFKNLPDLPFAVTNASVVTNQSIIYLAGGQTINDVSDKFFSLNLKKPSEGWKILPSLPKPVSHAVMLVQSNGDDNCIYLIGGRKENNGSTSELYSSTLQFDLKTKKWSEKKSLPYNLSAGTGMAKGANQIFLFGGDKGEIFHKTELLIAAINNEKDETKKKQLIRQKDSLQSSHPGFCKDVLLYNTVTDKWSVIGNIPFDVPVTTSAVQWGNDVLIPGGEIRAGVRTPQILKGKFSHN